jgi:hypothetical protein
VEPEWTSQGPNRSTRPADASLAPVLEDPRMSEAQS